MKSSRKILVVAAHPDDEILGCGALTARLASEGARVWTLILGEGMTSRKGLSAAAKAKGLKALKAAAQRANKALGVAKLIMKSFPDNRFDSVPRLNIVQAIEDVVSELKPDTVYTHSSCDLNIDHQITCEAVKTACRPLPGASVKRILSFEVPSATEWGFDQNRSFQPDTFADVTGFIDTKIKSLSAYSLEMREFPHPRSEQYIRALSRVRGSQSGKKEAEAFKLIRSIEV